MEESGGRVQGGYFQFKFSIVFFLLDGKSPLKKVLELLEVLSKVPHFCLDREFISLPDGGRRKQEKICQVRYR